MANSGSADEETRALVNAAAKGDHAAWERLVHRFAGLVWSVTRSLGLSSDVATEVYQSTWLRLLERIDRIDDPGRLGAWLADTARREADLRSR